MALLYLAFEAALEDGNKNGCLPISSLRAESSRGGGGVLSETSEKSSQSLLSPWSLATLHAHLACDQVFLSQAHDPVSSLQTLQMGRNGGLADSAACWAPAQEQLLHRVTVSALWQPPAESPFLGSLFAACFLILMPGSSAALRHPQSSCDPKDPETTLFQLGFHPCLAT